MDETKLLNYLDGKLDADECIEVESWSQESDDNRSELEQLYFTLQLSKRSVAKKHIDLDQSFSDLQCRIDSDVMSKRFSRFIKMHRWTTIVAAFLVGVICASTILFHTMVKSYQMEVSTASRQRAQVVLPDGTKVWLNASTTLLYQGNIFKRERNIKLDGEAYFEVKRNEQIPFIVESKGVQTEVLGTKFNVKARQEEQAVTTTLLEGSVKVRFPHCLQDGVVLIPGQSVSVNSVTFQSELKQMVSAHDVLLWIDGRIDFKKATLLEITNRLSRYYDVSFEFKNEQLKRESFTCLFRTDDKIEEIMEALTLTKQFRVDFRGKHIIISL